MYSPDHERYRGDGYEWRSKRRTNYDAVKQEEHQTDEFGRDLGLRSWRERSGRGIIMSPRRHMSSTLEHRNYVYDNPSNAKSRRSSSPSFHPSKPRGLCLSPTKSYLAISEEILPPTAIPPRKLLILDLNGTLLRRSQKTNTTLMRHVYPRPYMPTFKQYLFHPKTKEWLDTMIWSSAQPASVRDMVAKCFGEDEFVNEKYEEGFNGALGRWHYTLQNLIAIWARDTLGLSANEYNKKVATLKDLSKAWQSVHFPSKMPHVEGVTDDTSVSTPHTHSALTTILVDDSPGKALLQPYNHVCVHEYDTKIWQDSLKAKERSQLLEEHRSHPSSSANEAEEDKGTSLDAPPPTESPQLSTKMLKKLEKKRARINDVLQSMKSMDRTLIALIGILEHMKTETNIAAWIKGGGLWARGLIKSETRQVSSDQAMKSTESPLPFSSDIPSSSSPIPGTSRDDVPLSPGRSLEQLLLFHRSQRILSPPPASVYQAPRTGPGRSNSSLGDGASVDKEAEMWFHDANVVSYWCSEGEAALERLGLLEVDGVIPIPGI